MLQDADKLSERYCKLYNQLHSEYTAKYFSNERLVTRGTVYDAEAPCAQGDIKLSSTHPLRNFLSTPKLPPELAAALDRQP
jgi:hypothetical protein